MLCLMEKLLLSTNKNNLRTYENIQEIATGQEDDYTTDCLPEDNCFKKHYKMVAIDLSKQQALDANPKAILDITVFFMTDE